MAVVADSIKTVMLSEIIANSHLMNNDSTRRKLSRT
ncbi:hypothetical protein LINPERHAP2_LOCUS16945, partial [Linum perenne]